MLFAPVFIDPVIVVRGWRFVPSFVVYDDFLFGALFIRPGYCHYYFGDYFDDRYDRLGFVAWFDFRIGRFGYDPLFGYYRRHFDSDRRWEGNLHRLYADRRSGAAPRPPRTLDLQHTLMQNITNKTVKVGDVKTVTALTPLAKVDPKVVKLEAVSKAQIAQEQKAGERLHELANHRREVEAKVISEGVPDRHTDPSKSIKLDLPIPSTTFKGSTEIKTIAPPPLPTLPKHEPVAPPPPPRRDVTPPPPPPPPKKDPPPSPKKDGSPKKPARPAPVDHPRSVTTPVAHPRGATTTVKHHG